MRAMALKLIGIPLRAMPITSPNFPLDPAWTPEMAALYFFLISPDPAPR